MDKGSIIGLIGIIVTIVIGVPSIRSGAINTLKHVIGWTQRKSEDFLVGAVMPACLFFVVSVQSATTVLQTNYPTPVPLEQLRRSEENYRFGAPWVHPHVAGALTDVVHDVQSRFLEAATADVNRSQLGRQLAQAVRQTERDDREIQRLRDENREKSERVVQLEAERDVRDDRLAKLLETIQRLQSAPEFADLGPIRPVFPVNGESLMRRVLLTRGWENARIGRVIRLDVENPYPGDFTYAWSVTGCESQARGSATTYFFQFVVQAAGRCTVTLRSTFSPRRVTYTHSFDVPIEE